jgi:simple sugar transport system ATP-binding protein
VLTIEHAVKSFGATLALDDVSLAIAPGEIVGLLGENGAGKTTLMRAAAGEIALGSGRVHRPSRTGFVHQHFTVVPAFTIAENLALSRRGIITRAAMEKSAEEEIARSGVKLDDVGRLARDLPVGEKAKLELIKAVAHRPELLILDEPTSVLTPIESAELFALVRQLAAAGTAVVFISHKVPEVLEIAKRIVVMRRGRVVVDRTSAGMGANEIADAMLSGAPPTPAASSPAGAAEMGGAPLVTYQNLTLRKSEIVAVVGVAGNGQTELAESLRTTHRRIGFVPEDRTRNAVVGEMTIAENIALGASRWNRKDAIATARRLIDSYSIKARGPLQLVRELSGGNQQKVVLARELDRRPELIVASEPTRGLDLEATAFVHGQLRSAVLAGAGLLLITSDLDEAFALADGIHVIYRGRLSDRMTPDEARQRVASLMAGVA